MIGLAFLASVAPLILAGFDQGPPETNHTRAGYDQSSYHYPAIDKFARQWPHFDFSDYSAAMTPGYHLVLAAVDRFISGDLRTLRFAGALFSVGLLATLAAALGRSGSLAVAGLLCLPLACSLYVYSSAAWLLPDNAGWWAVLMVLLIALRPRVNGWTYLLGGAAALALVLCRQSHLWVAAPLCAAAWIGGEREDSPSLQSVAGNWGRLTLMAAALVPAVAAVAWFASRWHGMTPPSQRPLVGGANAAGPAIALAVVGTLGLFFLPLFPPVVRRRQLPALAAAGMVIGLVIGALPVSTYSVDQGRFSGVWNAVIWAPTFCDRSPIIIGSSMLGGIVLALWLAALPRRERWIWATAVVAFGAACVATRDAYQRYDEPLVLIGAALSARHVAQRAPRWAWAGPAVLALILAGITVRALR